MESDGLGGLIGILSLVVIMYGLVWSGLSCV